MTYSETYVNLCHGTDVESANIIKEKGFEVRGSKDSWCGKGVYFYDIKKKAWWAAKRKCREIKQKTGKKVMPTVIFADILNVRDVDIFDLRVYEDLCEFEDTVNQIFGDFEMEVPEAENEIERIIILRSMLIGYYAEKYNKKLVIGSFKQRPQEKYEQIIDFSNNLDIVFGIETIYCVKDIDIIKNVREGGKS